MPGPLQQHRQRVHVVGAEHDVHPRRPAHDLGPVLLRQAAAHRDLHARLRGLDRPQVAEVAVEPVVGVLPDRAGVEHDDVGGGVRAGPRVARRLEQPGHPLGVVHVHLAPVGADVVAAAHRPSVVRPARWVGAARRRAGRTKGSPAMRGRSRRHDRRSVLRALGLLGGLALVPGCSARFGEVALRLATGATEGGYFSARHRARGGLAARARPAGAAHGAGHAGIDGERGGCSAPAPPTWVLPGRRGRRTGSRAAQPRTRDRRGRWPASTTTSCTS